MLTFSDEILVSQEPPEENMSQVEEEEGIVLTGESSKDEDASGMVKSGLEDGQEPRKLKRYPPTRAERQSSRVQKAKYGIKMIPSGVATQGRGKIGMDCYDKNPFTVLNDLEDDDLVELAKDCDVILGVSREEVEETLDAMRLEECLRAAVAEASYKAKREGYLNSSGLLESANLALDKVDNTSRNFESQVLNIGSTFDLKGVGVGIGLEI